ncbi:MAG: PAS domain S-box protein [Flexistipes sinusarabici]|uniref:histidine kinase n=1 Tax=Flexistipes sinusarabici TaxID=2352 RepID=A0A5D0MQB5_FLESI|nr:CHASE domain-containing protein [Flexistipes sinusarabici]TYB33831.1 MAG: PAS domain S-box protein [Flexistipes sinusarabici]
MDSKIKTNISLFKRFLQYFIILIMLIATFVIWYHWNNAHKEKKQEKFKRYTESIADELTERVNHFKMILQGGAGVFFASEDVNRYEWRLYYEYRIMTPPYPTFQAVGFIKIIRASQLGNHISEIKEKGFSDYNVWPDENREVYAPIVFVEPFNKGNRQRLGFDTFSNPIYRNAMERARDTGKASLSDAVEMNILGKENFHKGFYMFIPIYERKTVPHTVKGRREKIEGYVYCAFSLPNLMNYISPSVSKNAFVKLYSGSKISPGNLLYSSSKNKLNTDGGLSVKKTLYLYGQEWTLAFTPTYTFKRTKEDVLAQMGILFAGLTLILLMILLLRSHSKTTKEAQKLAEEMTRSLRESQERFGKILEAAPNAIIVFNERGEILLANKQVKDIFGYTVDEIRDKNLDDLIPERFHDKHEELCKDYLKSPDLREMGQGLEVLARRKDNTEFPAEISLNAYYSNKETRVISVIQDITERRQAERDRIERKAAEDADRAKSTFVSNMSHEIRTPLNAIMGFAQILERDPSLSERQYEQVHTITRSGRHLLNLINDILDISKIESGQLTMHKNKFCLYTLLEDIEMMFRSRADGKGIQFLVDREENVPQYIIADEGKLRQILVNLIGNAVKFTKSGGVSLRVKAGEKDETGHEENKAVNLMFEVEDSGPGIPEEDLENIFDSFSQSQAGVEAGGTGLGLPISKRLINLMGGSISVDSELGSGSIFRFNIQVEETDAPEKQLGIEEMRRVGGLKPGSGSVRVLVVDDQKDNRNLIRHTLEPAGFEIKEAVNGEEALELFESWSPHAVLMDLRMPVMDGYQAARKIKSTYKGKDIPVIAVTASVFEDKKQDVVSASMDEYLRKPFRPEELFTVLKNVLDIDYTYSDSSETKKRKSVKIQVTVEDISSLPEELITGMKEAVENGDTAKLKDYISKVEDIDSEIAGGLRLLADRYNYDKLLKLLKK